MRLTGGADRGRKLKAPSGKQTRPTASKVREAIFNILGPADGISVLDLFAGTGALGMEALSRGAASAVFVDRDRAALTALRKNLDNAEFRERTRILGCDFRDAIRRLTDSKESQVRFGWVFVDPPYADGLVEPALSALNCRMLAHGGVVIVEHDRRREPPENCGELIRTDLRHYGDTGLSFYRCHGGLP